MKQPADSQSPQRTCNPLVAVSAAVIPGLGHLACGRRSRALGWFLWILGQSAICLAAPTLKPFVWWAGLLWLWSIIDAWWLAVGRERTLTIPIVFGVVLNLVMGWTITEVDLGALARGMQSTGTILSGLLTPELTSQQPNDILTQNVRLLAETIYMALIGTVIPIPVTLALSVLGAKNLMRGSVFGTSVYGISRSLMNLLRSIEVIVIAFMMATAVGIGPFAGVMALAIHGIGAQGKLYSEAIEDIDSGPVEAIAATGAGWIQRIVYGVLPQVTPQFIAFTMYRWDINVRMATVIGLVGGGGIGATLYQYIGVADWHKAGTSIWLIATAVILMDWASAAVRDRFA
ncbi:MAG: phosphonate ABC transporter, permease protein PhnE [Armatimonadetes bacterium]|nr:phosphonate ABC transporter, permease protein PhnE [Armatimonadota bacterium]